MVKVSIKEILQRWKSTTDLRKISQIKNKKFNSMNILGKVINILRISQQRRNDGDADGFLQIPQYSRNGYISITKLP